MKRPIVNNTDEGEFVYDPFSGSGTTFIAAERTNRKCLGIELNPVYCDAIIRRWQQETGKKAILSGDGVSFDDLNCEVEE
jgi:DNA modification methylase